MDISSPPAPSSPDAIAYGDEQWQGKHVSLQTSAVQGRYQVSNAKIRKGTVIFQALPYAASLFESHKKRICARCYKFNPSGSLQLRCPSCSDVWYCSKECAEADLSMHKHSCPFFQRLGKHDKELQPLIRMILVVVIRKHLEDTGAFKRDLKDEPSFADVDVLISHEEEWSDAEKLIWKKMSLWIIDLLTGTPFWCEWISVKNLMRLISQIECNCFGIHAVGKETIYGRVLYPRASFFNHSCAPNCDTMQQVATQTMHMCFIVNRDIEAGEEVTISYINENRPRSSRRENLSNDYHFQCICARCETEKSLPHVKVTYSKSKNSHHMKGMKKKEEKLKQKALAKAKAADSSSAVSSKESGAQGVPSVQDLSLADRDLAAPDRDQFISS